MNTAPIVDEERGIAVYYHHSEPYLHECLHCGAITNPQAKHACQPEEKPMQTLPAVSPAKALEQKHSPVVSGFQSRAELLYAQYLELSRKPEPWGAMTEARFEGLATVAKAIDDEAVTWLKAWEQESKTITQPAYQAWKATTNFVNKMKAGPEAARSAARNVLVGFGAREKRKADEARRADEACRLAAAKAEREQQAKHLAEMAAVTGDDSYAEEAEQLQAEPIRVTPAQAPEQTKIEGVSTGTKKIAMVTDPYAFLTWLVASKDRCEAMWSEVLEWKDSGLNAMAKRGLEPDGVFINEVPTYANRKRSEVME